MFLELHTPGPGTSPTSSSLIQLQSTPAQPAQPYLTPSSPIHRTPSSPSMLSLALNPVTPSMSSSTYSTSSASELSSGSFASTELLLSQSVNDSPTDSGFTPVAPPCIESSQAIAEVREAVDNLGFSFESLGIDGNTLDTFVSLCSPELQVLGPDGVTFPTISGFSLGRPKSWLLNYTVISFMMNGQLFSEYH